MDVAEHSEDSFTSSCHEDSNSETSIDSSGMKELASSPFPETDESTNRVDSEFSTQHEPQDSTGLKKLCTSAEASDSDDPTKLMKLGTGQGSASDTEETGSLQYATCSKGLSYHMYIM